MNFQEFWRRLSVELKTNKKFKTLKRSKPFEAYADINTITVIPNSNKPRPVPIKEFQKMWEIMKNHIRSERYVNTNRRYSSSHNSSYISALIDHVVSDHNME